MAGKDLITEQSVRAMPAGSELVLGPDKIATPSALDAAYERGINVRYVAAGESSQTKASSKLWDRMRAQEGTYVVVVRNGRASVSRLTENGSTEFGKE